MRLIRQWLFLLPLVLLCLLPAHAGKKPPQIFLRIYIQTAGEGLATTQAMSVQVPPNGEVIQVRALPEVSEKDLTAVKVLGDGSVQLSVNHRGKINLYASTGENQGRIMVVMIDGSVVYAPVIDEQINSNFFVIPHPLPPETIKMLQDVAAQNVKDAPPTLAPSTMSTPVQ